MQVGCDVETVTKTPEGPKVPGCSEILSLDSILPKTGSDFNGNFNGTMHSSCQLLGVTVQKVLLHHSACCKQLCMQHLQAKLVSVLVMICIGRQANCSAKTAKLKLLIQCNSCKGMKGTAVRSRMKKEPQNRINADDGSWKKPQNHM